MQTNRHAVRVLDKPRQQGKIGTTRLKERTDISSIPGGGAVNLKLRGAEHQPFSILDSGQGIPVMLRAPTPLNMYRTSLERKGGEQPGCMLGGPCLQYEARPPAKVEPLNELVLRQVGQKTNNEIHASPAWNSCRITEALLHKTSPSRCRERDNTEWNQTRQPLGSSAKKWYSRPSDRRHRCGQPTRRLSTRSGMAEQRPNCGLNQSTLNLSTRMIILVPTMYAPSSCAPRSLGTWTYRLTTGH